MLIRYGICLFCFGTGFVNIVSVLGFVNVTSVWDLLTLFRYKFSTVLLRWGFVNFASVQDVRILLHL